MFDVAKDEDGVCQAVHELLEEFFFQHSALRGLDRADEADRARLLAHGPQRTLSPGYYKWAGYLLGVEEMRNAQIPVEGLQAIEMSGLVQVARARHTFNVAHPTCACGQRLESRWVESCEGCGAKFRRPE